MSFCLLEDFVFLILFFGLTKSVFIVFFFFGGGGWAS